MPQRNAVPFSWSPKGLTDSLDGTTSFQGAMKVLQNIIPAPSTAQLWQPRPGAQRKTNFTGARAPLNPGEISARLIVGDLEYGMVPSTLNTGFDEPYCYDLANDSFIAVTGIMPNNVPVSPPASGDWTPPIMAVVGTRVIVTHSGFLGDAGALFGVTTTGNTHLSTTIDGNPNLLGLLPGMAISGNGIPAGTTITDVEYFQLNTVGDTHLTTVIDNLLSTTGVAIGQEVFSGSTAVGSVVVSVDSPTQVTISPAASFATTGEDIAFVGATITLSNPATIAADGVTLTISGHPVNFGWFDLSGVSQSSVGNTTAGSPVITGNPSILAVQPGMSISGDGIPAGTTVIGAEPFVLTTTGTTVTGSYIIILVADTGGVFEGQEVIGAGIPSGAIVLTANGAEVGLNSPVPVGASNVTLTFIGATITMSADATATQGNVNLTIEGGTRSAPQWAAGDTDRNGLPSVPVGVAQMGGRAWFACGFDGIPWSDSGFACRRTSPTQALLTNDGLEVTALGQQQLSAALPGGIIQGLIAFEHDTKLQQIIGDPALGTLTMNVLPQATGTHAPLSIVPIGGGKLAFISPLGLRTVGLDGVISRPIGVDGQGITQPFQFAEHPSRICAAYNVGVLRITVQNSIPDGNPFEEYWFDIAREAWNGPHTFPARLIQPWRSTFVTTPLAVNSASLWQSDAFASLSTSYIENGARLSWIMRTVLLPDNAQVAMNAIIVSNIACVGSATDPLVITSIDEAGITIDSVTIPAQAGNRTFRQRPIDWSRPLIFKQMSIRVTGPSELGVLIGNHYALFEPLGYPPDDTDPPYYLLSSRSPFPILLADDGTTSLFPG